jgi:ATP-dependent Clp protease ATP-binding subunit ClpA
MFNRFSDRNKKLMNLAREEAQRLHHEYLGTEHVLLGLARLEGGLAVEVLKGRGIDGQRLRSEVLKIVKAGPTSAPAQQFPFTPGGRKVLELAMEEARCLGHDWIGTEHVLLGLLGERHGIAGEVLRGLRLELEAVRNDVVELLARDSDQGGAHPLPPATGFYERLTKNAKQLLNLTRLEAQQLSHGFLGTEHLLLGVARLEDGLAIALLARRGIDGQRLRAEVDKIVKQGPGTPMSPARPLPFTPRAKAVLERAIEEAARLRHASIGTEHVLLGLLCDTQGIAGAVLRELGLELEALRREILVARPPDV